jgi:hypothetical protein
MDQRHWFMFREPFLTSQCENWWKTRPRLAQKRPRWNSLFVSYLESFWNAVRYFTIVLTWDWTYWFKPIRVVQRTPDTPYKWGHPSSHVTSVARRNSKIQSSQFEIGVLLQGPFKLRSPDRGRYQWISQARYFSSDHLQGNSKIFICFVSDKLNNGKHK